MELADKIQLVVAVGTWAAVVLSLVGSHSAKRDADHDKFLISLKYKFLVALSGDDRKRQVVHEARQRKVSDIDLIAALGAAYMEVKSTEFGGQMGTVFNGYLQAEQDLKRLNLLDTVRDQIKDQK